MLRMDFVCQNMKSLSASLRKHFVSAVGQLGNFNGKDGHSGENADMVECMVNEQLQAVHPFPYIDRYLPIADWNDPIWSTMGAKEVSPDVGDNCSQ